MTKKFNQIMLDRMTTFGVQICRMTNTLPNYPASFVLAKQIVRSSTSIGANYREAQWARTSKEFLSKLQIALQEAEETRHWLETMRDSVGVEIECLNPLINECAELIAILVASINTTRRRILR